MSSSESSSSNVVEVDSIFFETLMPVQTIRVAQAGEHIPVQFGIRITNQTSTPYRFNRPSFIPEVFDSTGQLVSGSGGRNPTRRRTSQDVPLINSGKSTTFWTNVELLLVSENRFCLSGYIRYGSVWSASLQLGTYQLRLTYNNDSPQYYDVPVDMGRTDLHHFWVGTVSTPLIKFCLVQP